MGDLYSNVIHCNNIVDKAVSKDVALSTANNVSVVSEGLDEWQLVYKSNFAPIFPSVRKFVYEAELLKNINVLKTSKPAFSVRLFDPLVNHKETTHLLHKAVPFNKNVATFLYRILEKSLSTKNRVYKSVTAKSYVPPANSRKRRKLETTYANPFCHTCLLHLKVEVVEDTSHVFSGCLLAVCMLDKAAGFILNIYNKYAAPNIAHSFPFWFSNSLPRHVAVDADEVALMSFPTHLGDTGYIPRALKAWFKSKSKHIKLWKNAMRDVIFTLHACLHDRWVSRCYMLFNY